MEGPSLSEWNGGPWQGRGSGVPQKPPRTKTGGAGILRIGSLCAKLCHNTYLTGVEAVMYTVYKTIVFLKLLAFFCAICGNPAG